jgi:hypothetical protein
MVCRKRAVTAVPWTSSMPTTLHDRWRGPRLLHEALDVRVDRSVRLQFAERASWRRRSTTERPVGRAELVAE